MNNRDEDLTLENVDERIEQLTHAQNEPAGTPTPLTRAARDLQRVYEEERRLDHVWERISSRARTLESTMQPAMREDLNHRQSFQGEQRTMRETPSTRPGSFQNTPDGPFQQQRPPRRRGWRNFGLGLAAAVVLIAIFAWTMIGLYHGRGTQIASGGATPAVGTPAIVTPTPMSPSPTPTYAAVTPTPMPSATATPIPTPAETAWQPYTCQYFTVKYPARWVLTNSGPGGAYLQTVQFRPAANSPIQANVSVMYNNDLSAAQLLQQDSIVKAGTLESTKTVTYNGLNWTVGVVSISGSAQAQAAEIEVAYSNQTHSYRAEFAAPPDQYAAYSSTFQSMLASFTPTR